MKNKTSNIISIVSILLCIIPIIITVIFYNKLPDQIPSHFNFKGEADAYGSKFSTLILMPLILSGANLLAIIITKNDPKLKNQSRILRELMKFIIPTIIIIINSISILTSLNIASINITSVICIFISILFVIIGNYLPKCKQNYTLGIKTSMDSDNENWTKTHRVGGFLYVLIGIITLILSLCLPDIAIFFILISVIISSITLSIYSFVLYKKSKKSLEYKI